MKQWSLYHCDHCGNVRAPKSDPRLEVCPHCTQRDGGGGRPLRFVKDYPPPYAGQTEAWEGRPGGVIAELAALLVTARSCDLGNAGDRERLEHKLREAFPRLLEQLAGGEV